MTENDKLVNYLARKQAEFKADESFYEYEQDKYPDGDSPFADIHREVYSAGYVAHWHEMANEMERT